MRTTRLTNQVLRLGIIGVGRWADNYEKSITKTSIAHGIRVFNEPSASEFYKNPPDASVILNAIDNLHLDGIVLACDPSVQESVTPTLIERNVPLILEKPLATKRLPLTKIKKAFLQAAKPTVFVNHFHLFDPSFQLFCRDKNFNEISTISVNDYGKGPFRRSLEPLFDWGPHAIGILLKITNQAPLRFKVLRTLLPRKDGRVAEKLMVQLDFQNGVSGRLNFGNAFKSRVRDITITKCKDEAQESWCSAINTDVPANPIRRPMDILLNEFTLSILCKRQPQYDSFRIAFLSALILIEIDEASTLGGTAQKQLSSKFHEAYSQF